MNKILGLMRHDYKRATRNVISMLLLVGVVLIPSFFSWFNVIASLDPFDNVKYLKVAVASDDAGYQSELFPLKINVGSQVISSLRANADLQWVFTDPGNAVEGTKSGDYYAAIVLPKDFSERMMTFLSPNASPVSIEYYENQKTNAISPEITGQAATEVSGQIDETFAKTIDTVGLTLISSLSNNLGSQSVKDALARMSSNVNALGSQFHANANTARMFSSLLSSTQPLITSSSALIDSSRDAVQGAAGSITGGAQATAALKAAVQAATSSLTAAFTSSVASYESLGKEVDTLYAAIGQQGQSTSSSLNALASRVDQQISEFQKLRNQLQTQTDSATDPALRAAIEQVIASVDGSITKQQALRDELKSAASAVTTTNTNSQASRQGIDQLVRDTQSAIAQVNTSYSSTLRPKLDQLATSLTSVQGSVASIGGDLSTAASALQTGGGSLTGSLSDASTVMGTVGTSLEAAAGRFDTLGKALGEASTSGDMAKVSELIGSNPAVLAGELSAPVALKTIPVFRAGTFGEQMTPFYSVLGLWVGAILLSVLIRVDKIHEPTRLTVTQQYLGRFGIFIVLSLLQSTLVYVGLLGFVGIGASNALALVFAGWVMSLVFVSITYTMVVALGEAGKAVSVFLLVVQISAGGGAYPLAVLPQWFQNISPWLPVTHGIDAVRAALFGFYDGDYWKALGLLLIFAAVALLIGLVLRRPLIKANDKMAEQLESTKLFLL